MSNVHQLKPLTEAELDALVVRHQPTQALLDHLERRNRIPRIPQSGRYVIPTRAPWWVRLWQAIKGER